MSAYVTAPATELVSYGGQRARAELVRPGSLDELHTVLTQAFHANRKVTFRGQGHGFDTQSLGTDLVICMDRLLDVHFSDDSSWASAGAGVPWGTLVRSARARGSFPAVVVSTSEASVAGTAAAHCVSRFTPTCGQEGAHVRALDLMLPSGQLLTCSREREPEVFWGAIGGLGYLGAITRVEVNLPPLAHDQVETRIVQAGAPAEVVAACTPLAIAADPPATRFAILLPGLDRGIAYAARYVSGEPLHRYPLVHQPRSPLRVLGELLMRMPTANRIFWWLAFATRAARYVDPIEDYTFFMDGNARARHLGRRLGAAMRVTQQSFLVPVAATVEFIARARREFGRLSLYPTMSDLLYAPADRALLAPTFGRDGFMISFAFETSRARLLAGIAAAFTSLAHECGALGGRVSLTKHVIAAPGELERQYAASLPEFAALKRRLDPGHMVGNEFLARVFPSLV